MTEGKDWYTLEEAAPVVGLTVRTLRDRAKVANAEETRKANRETKTGNRETLEVSAALVALWRDEKNAAKQQGNEEVNNAEAVHNAEAPRSFTFSADPEPSRNGLHHDGPARRDDDSVSPPGAGTAQAVPPGLGELIEELRATLADVRLDRDQWRDQAARLTDALALAQTNVGRAQFEQQRLLGERVENVPDDVKKNGLGGPGDVMPPGLCRSRLVVKLGL